MKLSKKHTQIIVFLVLLAISISVGAWIVYPRITIMEDITNGAIEACQSVGIPLTVGNKRATGFFIRTFRFEDVEMEFDPLILRFSSITATPSAKSVANNIIDGRVSFNDVALDLPFFGGVNFGNGVAHLFVDDNDDIYITHFELKGICNVTGHFNILRSRDILDYSFTFVPDKEHKAIFITMMSFGVPLKKIGDDRFVLEGKPKIPSISPVKTGKK